MCSRTGGILGASISDLKTRIGDPDLVTEDKVTYRVHYSGHVADSSLNLEAVLSAGKVTQYTLTRN